MKVLISIPKPHWSVPHMPAMLSTYFPMLPKSSGLEPVNGIPQVSLPVGLQFSSEHGRHVHEQEAAAVPYQLPQRRCQSSGLPQSCSRHLQSNWVGRLLGYESHELRGS